MTEPSFEPSPVGVALDWVAKVGAAAAVMVLPGLAGQWLDHRLNVRFCTLLGFGLGLTAGIGYLLVITRRPPRSPHDPPGSGHLPGSGRSATGGESTHHRP